MRNDEEPWILDAHSWHEEVLADDLPTDRLSEIDREAIFAAVRESSDFLEDVEVELKQDERDAALGADAPLLVPRTRMFIRAGKAGRKILERMIRFASLYAIVGSIDPVAGFAGLTIDFVLNIFRHTSRLSEQDAEVVEAVLRLTIDKKKTPSTRELVRYLEHLRDVRRRLDSLKNLEILRRRQQGWEVCF